MKFIRNFKKIYKYSYGCRKYIILYFIITIITSIIGVALPTVVALRLVNFTNSAWKKAILYSVIYLFLNFLMNIITFINSYVTEKFSKIIVSNVQINLAKEIFTIKQSDIDNKSNGLFIERLTNDARSVSNVFIRGFSLFNGLIKNIGILIIIFNINIWIFFLAILYAIVDIIRNKIQLKIINNRDKQYRKQKENTNGFTTEIIRGLKDIKMLNAENSFLDKTKETINSLNQSNYNISYVYRLFNLIYEFLKDMFELLLYLIIIYFVYTKRMDIALGLVILQYQYSIFSLSFSLGLVFNYVRDFNLSCDRVFALFGSNEFQKERFGNRHIDNIEGNFEFKNVCFGYNKDRTVLNDISFKIKANETVAFVGRSGVGKSTIFNLLIKLYDVDSGSILIDGVDIRKLDKDTIRGNITIVSQDPYIFHMTIRDNLKIVKSSLTEEEMIEACKLACLDEFINTLPLGYDTMIGEGGVNLSGGQKQRLAIARAFIQKTKIILFDEATSALDNETQALIQKAIANMSDNYTILIIAHRLSTIINSDRILFMDKGKIVATGSHKYLLRNNNNYKKLYESEIVTLEK